MRLLVLMQLVPAPAASFGERLYDFSIKARDVLVDMGLAILIVIVGWALATGLFGVTRGLLRALRFNQGIQRLLGGSPAAAHEPAVLAAWAVYWTTLTVAVLIALDSLGVPVGPSVGSRLAEVLPRILTSGFLFAVGALLAAVLGGLSRRFFESAGLGGARLRGQLISGVLTGFAALIAVEQLGLAAQFVMALGVVAVGAVGLGLALAFGLGCRELARDFVIEYLRSLDEPERQSRPR